mmetsp:Transcript_36625/g.85604  ORF Transcript_36625/g.85604 Transcript_36625/m.85604 type:complete len:99 (-) Transcript_36625:1184-1480(-)
MLRSIKSRTVPSRPRMLSHYARPSLHPSPSAWSRATPNVYACWNPRNGEGSVVQGDVRRLHRPRLSDYTGKYVPSRRPSDDGASGRDGGPSFLHELEG